MKKSQTWKIIISWQFKSRRNENLNAKRRHYRPVSQGLSYSKKIWTSKRKSWIRTQKYLRKAKRHWGKEKHWRRQIQINTQRF